MNSYITRLIIAAVQKYIWSVVKKRATLFHVLHLRLVHARLWFNRWLYTFPRDTLYTFIHTIAVRELGLIRKNVKLNKYVRSTTIIIFHHCSQTYFLPEAFFSIDALIEFIRYFYHPRQIHFDVSVNNRYKPYFILFKKKK